MADFPRELLACIRQCIPTLQAAEVLLFLAEHRQRGFTEHELADALGPTLVSESAVREYVALLVDARLVVKTDQHVSYAPATPELDECVRALAREYNERPVTLIRTIYRIADSTIQSFADSFKLKD
jgi:hypothetical protein